MLKKLSTSTTLVLCGLAVGAVTAGGVVAAGGIAQADSATPTVSGAPERGHEGRGHQDRGHGLRGQGGQGGRGHGDRELGPDRGVLHGEFVVVDPAKPGAYLTREVQTGVLLSSTATSITLKSADGYLKTWAVNASTEVRSTADKHQDKAAKPAVVADLAVGSTVFARGIKNADGSFTATKVGVPGTPRAEKLQDDESPSAAPSAPAPAAPTSPAPASPTA